MFGPPGSRSCLAGPLGFNGGGQVGCTGPSGAIGVIFTTDKRLSQSRRFQGNPDLFAYPPRYILNDFVTNSLVTEEKKKIVAHTNICVIPLKGGRFLTFAGSGTIVLLHDRSGEIKEAIEIVIPGVMSVSQLCSNPSGTHFVLIDFAANIQIYCLETKKNHTFQLQGQLCNSIAFISDTVFIVHRSANVAGQMKHYLTFYNVDGEALRNLEGICSFTILGENRIAAYSERRPSYEEDKWRGVPNTQRAEYSERESEKMAFNVVDIAETDGSSKVRIVDSFSLMYNFDFGLSIKLFSYCQRLFARHRGKCTEFSAFTGLNQGEKMFPVEGGGGESWREEPLSEERILLSDGTFGDGKMTPMYASKEDHLWLKREITELTGLTDPADVIAKFVFKYI